MYDTDTHQIWINPNLGKETYFLDLIDHQQFAQEIMMSIANRRLDIQSNMSDNQKIKSHGMDIKTSFRGKQK
jgi:hypothetical protein